MTGLHLLTQALLASSAAAMPFGLDDLHLSTLFRRQAAATPRALGAAEQAGYTPHARFASAAYCKQSLVNAWNCGDDCKGKNSPNFKIAGVGGDNKVTLPWYVGYDDRDLTMSGSTNATRGTVVVSFQGTPGDIGQSTLPLRLLDVEKKALAAGGPNLFKTVDPGVKIHTGFADLHGAIAQKVQDAVRKSLADNNATKIVVTGHSLGAAIAVIGAASLQQNFPGITVSSIAFAAPRIGNPAFSTFAGKTINVIRHVNNKADFVPVIPGRTDRDLNGPIASPLQAAVIARGAYEDGQAYASTKGEVHINQADSIWYDCGATVDNPNKLCSTGAVTSISESTLDLIAGLIAKLGKGDISGLLGGFTFTLRTILIGGPPAFLGLDHNGPYNDVRMSAGCSAINGYPAD